MTRERILTPAELAATLGLPVAAIDRLVAEGLPVLTLDGARRFLWSAVLGWLHSRLTSRGLPLRRSAIPAALAPRKEVAA